MGNACLSFCRQVKNQKEKNAKNQDGNREPNQWQNLFSQVKKEKIVGIFSMSSQEDYRWLVELMRPHVKEVKPFLIDNDGLLKFKDDVSRCRCGILYHTFNRGRINITDVADSLYDRHLKAMSDQLGKDHIIVVVDDLEDSSDQQRAWILQHQPSIEKMAKTLILISKQQKMMYKA